MQLNHMDINKVYENSRPIYYICRKTSEALSSRLQSISTNRTRDARSCLTVSFWERPSVAESLKFSSKIRLREGARCKSYAI